MATQPTHYEPIFRLLSGWFNQMLTWNHLINQWVLFGYLLSGSLHGDVVSACELIDFKKDLKVALSSVGKMYIVAGI